MDQLGQVRASSEQQDADNSSQILALSAELTNEKTAHQTLQDEYTAVSSARQRLQNCLEETRGSLQGLQGRTEQAVRTSQESCEKLRSQLEELESEAQAQGRDMLERMERQERRVQEQAQASAAALAAVKDEMGADVATHVAALESLQLAVAGKDEEVQSYQGLLRAAEVSGERSRCQLQECEVDKGKLQGQVVRLEESYERVREELEQAHIEMTNGMQAAAKLTEQVLCTTEQVNEGQARRLALETELHEARQRLGLAESCVKEVRAEGQLYAHTANEAEAALRLEIQTLRQEGDTLRALEQGTATRLDDTASAMEKVRADWAADTMKLSAQVAGLSQELQQSNRGNAERERERELKLRHSEGKAADVQSHMARIGNGSFLLTAHIAFAPAPFLYYFSQLPTLSFQPLVRTIFSTAHFLFWALVTFSQLATFRFVSTPSITIFSTTHYVFLPLVPFSQLSSSCF